MMALITGAAQRLGRAMAETLHAAGYDVWLHYHHSQKACEQLATGLNASRPDSASVIQADLGASEGADILVDIILTHTSRLSVLVNNASIYTADAQLSQTQQERLYQCNSRTPVRLIEGLTPNLCPQGNIINITDIYAEFPRNEYSHYCHSKQQLADATRHYALKLAPKVRVNAIAPGAMLWAEGQNETPEYRATLLKQIPLERLGGTQAICEALLFLLRCDYMTGQTLRVDGGRSLTL